MDQTQASNDAISDSQAASSTARDKLMDGLKSSINEAEKWLSDEAEKVAGVTEETRARFTDALTTARGDLRKLEESLVAHGKQAADTVNVYVQDNPWKAVGLGAAVGIIIGMLIARD